MRVDTHRVLEIASFHSITEEKVTKEAICQRKGCGKGKADVEEEEEEEDSCEHHPGCPIFHEGKLFFGLSFNEARS
jgi:hypothetical protein